MEDIRFFNNKKLTIRIIIFLIFYIIFFLYMRYIVEGYQSLNIFAHSLMFIIYLISLYKIKWGLYLFIFLIPLLNSPLILNTIRPRYIIVFLFFGLFLGFLINDSGKFLSSTFLKYPPGTVYDSGISRAMLIFSAILLISCAITILRYSNFYPFITNNYYDLIINVNGVRSTGSIIWTIRFFFNYFIGFLFFVLIFNVIDKVSDIVYSLLSLILATTISAGGIIYQYYFNPYLGNVSHWVNSGRYNSTFTDPNALGGYVILLFPVYIGMFIYFKRWHQRLLIFFPFLLYLVLLFLSGSRSAFVGIILAMVIFTFIFIIMGLRHIRGKWISYSRCLKIVLILLPVIILLILAVFPFYLINDPESPVMEISLIGRTVETFKTGIKYTREIGLVEGLKSISNFRYIFWGQAVEMFKDYPLTGVGQGSYILQLPNYLTINRTGYLSDGKLVADYTGNYYLQVLSELGLPGIILILFIIYLLASRVIGYFKAKKRLRRLECSDWLLAVLFISFISMLAGQFFGPHTNFDEVQLTFWLVIGLMIAYIKVKQIDFIDKFKPLQIGSSIRFDIYGKISLAVILIIFTSSFIFSSATSLSINAGQNLYDIKGNYKGWENTYGFYEEESINGENFRWTGIDASEVVDKNGSKMVIPMKDAIPLESIDPVSVKVFVDNLLVRKVMLEHDKWTDVQIDIPDFTKDKFTLTLAFSRSWTPKEIGLTPDTRELGVRTGNYSFIE
jgi:putative inorganic carbon (hco3(-)) transporter